MLGACKASCDVLYTTRFQRTPGSARLRITSFSPTRIGFQYKVSSVHTDVLKIIQGLEKVHLPTVHRLALFCIPITPLAFLNYSKVKEALIAV